MPCFASFILTSLSFFSEMIFSNFSSTRFQFEPRLIADCSVVGILSLLSFKKKNPIKNACI